LALLRESHHWHVSSRWRKVSWRWKVSRRWEIAWMNSCSSIDHIAHVWVVLWNATCWSNISLLCAATLIKWVAKTLEVKVIIKSDFHVIRGLVLDISLLSKLSHPVNNMAIVWLVKVDVFSNERVDDAFILISLENKLLAQKIG